MIILNELYNNFNDYLAHNLREKIIAKRVKSIGVVEVLIKGNLTMISSLDNTLTYITNTHMDITREDIIGALHLNPNDVYYISVEEVMLSLDSEVTFESLARANQIKDLFNWFNMEFEEFFDYIDSNLPDYLLEFPEDAQ